jgi:hypothetical protein
VNEAEEGFLDFLGGDSLKWLWIAMAFWNEVVFFVRSLNEWALVSGPPWLLFLGELCGKSTNEFPKDFL